MIAASGALHGDGGSIDIDAKTFTFERQLDLPENAGAFMVLPLTDLGGADILYVWDCRFA